MFLPEVTNSRSPITFAPVVRPTSCWIEPRYSPFFDITASWTVTADAGAAKASAAMQAGRSARSDLMAAPTLVPAKTCGMRWAVLLVASVALVGCGGLEGSATASQRALVSRYLKRVDDVSCTQHSARVTRCEVRVRKVPVGSESWHCVFVRGGAEGSDECWSDGGSRRTLRGVTVSLTDGG